MGNSVTELNFDEILTLIQGQLLAYMNSDENYEKYKDFNIILSKEQQFMKLKDKDPNTLYIVVKFGSADVTFGQTVLPVTMVALTEQNRIESAYSLFYEYAQKYNLIRVNDNTINQVYESPSITGNFNAVYEGYRSIVTMSCAFVIGKNSNDYKVYYYYKVGEGENAIEYANEIPQVSTSFGFVGNPDTQAFYNSDDYTRTVIGFGSVSLGITTLVLSDNKLINDILSILGEVDSGTSATYVIDEGEDCSIISTKTLIETYLTQENIDDYNNVFIVVDGKDNVWFYEDGEWIESEKIGIDSTKIEKIDITSDLIQSCLEDDVINDNVIVKINDTLWVKTVDTWELVRTLEKVPTQSVINGKVNKTFRLGIVYRDGIHARIKDYKLTNVVGSQQMGQIPTIQLAFVE